jgi:hypothetical protein
VSSASRDGGGGGGEAFLSLSLSLSCTASLAPYREWGAAFPFLKSRQARRQRHGAWTGPRECTGAGRGSAVHLDQVHAAVVLQAHDLCCWPIPIFVRSWRGRERGRAKCWRETDKWTEGQLVLTGGTTCQCNKGESNYIVDYF